MRRRRRRKQAAMQLDAALEHVTALITRQPHWILFTAEFLEMDDAVRAMHSLSFVGDTGEMAHGTAGGVFPHRKGVTAVVGGQLTTQQVDEVSYRLLQQAQTFDLRWDKRDDVATERTAPARSLLQFGVAAKWSEPEP